MKALLPCCSLALALALVPSAPAWAENVAAPAPGPTVSATPAPEPSLRKESAHYAIEVVQPGATLGSPGKALLRILPRGGYKVNVEYPTALKLSATEGLELPSPTLKKKQALELTKAVARFEIPYQPKAPGQAQLTAKVRFSVCDAKTCELPRESLTWPVVIKAAK